MPLTDNQSRERIRDLNDSFRKTLDPALGRVMLTAGVDALPSDVRALVIQKVAAFDSFDTGNDPHSEHDFGSFDMAGDKFFWTRGIQTYVVFSARAAAAHVTIHQMLKPRSHLILRDIF